jgi:hypothetical protein
MELKKEISPQDKMKLDVTNFLNGLNLNLTKQATNTILTNISNDKRNVSLETKVLSQLRSILPAMKYASIVNRLGAKTRTHEDYPRRKPEAVETDSGHFNYPRRGRRRVKKKEG